MPRDWDRYYAEAAHREPPPDPLLVEVAEWAAPGVALELACGSGSNAVYLASLGWRVTAVDRSAAAIGIVRERAAGLAVTAVAADLERGEFGMAPDCYDLIANFYYLHRALFPHTRQGVRPGGLFVAAIHMADPEATSGPHNPDFLLEPGELRCAFADWKISFYSEARLPGRSRRAARIVARRA